MYKIPDNIYCCNQYKTLGDVWGYNFNISPQSGTPTTSTGIFWYLSTTWNFPTEEGEREPLHNSGATLSLPTSISPYYLDTVYFPNRYNKIISPIVERVLTMPYGGENGVLTYKGRAYLANIIRMMFGDKWLKIYNALTTVYNPLDNYSMTESGTDTNSNTKVSSGGGSETLLHGKRVTTTATNNENGESNVYGFNSSSAVPVGTEKNGITANGTEANSGEDKTTRTENGNETNNGTITHSLTRSGNIGVTTSQRMLESEMDVRTKYVYLKMIFEDIDSVLTLPIY